MSAHRPVTWDEMFLLVTNEAGHREIWSADYVWRANENLEDVNPAVIGRFTREGEVLGAVARMIAWCADHRDEIERIRGREKRTAETTRPAPPANGNAPAMEELVT